MGKTAAISVGTSSPFTFTDIDIYFFLKNLNYSGAQLTNDGALEFLRKKLGVDENGNDIYELSPAEIFYELLKYPPEALGFEVFSTSEISIGNAFAGKILPKFIPYLHLTFPQMPYSNDECYCYRSPTDYQSRINPSDVGWPVISKI